MSLTILLHSQPREKRRKKRNAEINSIDKGRGGPNSVAQLSRRTRPFYGQRRQHVIPKVDRIHVIKLNEICLSMEKKRANRKTFPSI